MTTKNKKGATANKQGKVLEETILPTLTSKGFNIVKYSEYKKDPIKCGEEVIIKRAPYVTIYGHNGYTEYKLLSKKYDLNIRIECKWQQSGGSVDEKFPYLYLNCIEAFPENNIMIIYGGKGAKEGGINWLKNAVKTKLFKNHNKNIMIMDLEDFLRWANTNLR